MSTRVVVTDYTFPDVAQERAAAGSAGASFAAFQARNDAEVAEAVTGAARCTEPVADTSCRLVFSGCH